MCRVIGGTTASFGRGSAPDRDLNKYALLDTKSTEPRPKEAVLVAVSAQLLETETRAELLATPPTFSTTW